MQEKENPPKRMSSMEKAQLTDSTARQIIFAERVLHASKTERLKALRLEQEASNPLPTEVSKPNTRKRKLQK